VPASYVIASMSPEHWHAVLEIYGEGIATGNATFETQPPDWNQWDSAHRKDCRLIALDESGDATGTGRILGWAALSPVSARHVYGGVAEVSLYVRSSARGRGVGRLLLETLVHDSEANGVWTLQAGVFPENAASIALHKACEFREVGVRRRIGRLGEVWRDVLLLERRSTKVGV